jgi:hypothetical protein
MKYLLDFDRTLFDTPACYEELTRVHSGPFEFVPEVWDKVSVCEYLYTDVLPWIATKIREDIYVVTAFTPSYGEASEAYQKSKLLCSTLTDQVAEVVVMQGLKGEIVAEIATQFPPTEPIVFVDDRIEQCLSVREHAPQVTCCLMVRDKAVIGDVREVQGMPVVHCLPDVDDVITKL